MLFEESPKSERIFDYFNRRIGQKLAPMGLLKALTIHGAESEYPTLNVMHEGRSREWKTRTLMLAMRMFSTDFYMAIFGEKTYHGMVEDYGNNWNGRCVILNDGTTMFASMAKRTRERWLSAFSSLLTERKYEYSDAFQNFNVKGRISLLINLATPSYVYHRREFLRTTLYNRMFIAHCWLTTKYNRQCKKNYNKTKGLRFKEKITERYRRKIRNFSEYEKVIEKYADDYAVLAVRSPIECQDIITAIVRENARINQRNYVCDDDMLLVRMLKPFNKFPLTPDKPRVIEGLKQGRSFRDICHLLGKPLSFKSSISKYRKEALESGALDYG